MTFADNIAKASSERYALVRLSPARDISTDLTEGTTDYFTMTFTGKPFSVIYDDGTEVVYTEDTGLSASQTWYYNEDTKVLYVRTADDIETTTKYIYVLHYITLTDQRDIELSVDPIVGGDKVIWEDRLKQAPRISSSIANMVDGTMTTAASSINLENSDSGISEWFTSKDTYNSRGVDVWFSVDGVLAKVFGGTIRTLDFTTTTIALGVVDKTTLFDNECYMGSTKSEAVYNSTSHTLLESDVGKISHFVLGETNTSFQPSSIYTRVNGSDDNPLPIYGMSTDTLQAVCTSYDATISSTTNRTWELCRTLQGSAKTLDFGTPISITSIGHVPGVSGELTTYGSIKTPIIRVFCSSGGKHNLRVGDTGIGYDNTLSLDTYMVVVEVTSDQYYKLALIGATYIAPTTDTAVLSRYDLPATSTAGSILIVYDNGVHITPVNKEDYDITYTNLSNGDRRVEVVFVDDFEILGSNGGHPRITESISPENCKIYFNYRTALETEHGTAINQALKSTELTVNSTSISDANTALSGGSFAMTIPSQDSKQHTTVRKVLAEMLQSTVGYVRADEDAEIYYELFDTPTGTSTRTDDDILSSTLIPRISYYDMFGEVLVDNTYLRDEDPLHPESFTMNEATRLHKATREKKLITVFDVIPTDMEDRYNTFFGQPRVTYKYRTASLDLDTQLGDYITLEASNLLGGVSSVDIIVTKFTKSTQGVDITGLAI